MHACQNHALGKALKRDAENKLLEEAKAIIATPALSNGTSD
jgi:hypothetical protein